MTETDKNKNNAPKPTAWRNESTGELLDFVASDGQEGWLPLYSMQLMAFSSSELNLVYVATNDAGERRRFNGAEAARDWAGEQGEFEVQQFFPKITTKHPLEIATATKFREMTLDIIDDCPGLTMQQDAWLSNKVRNIAKELGVP